MDSRARSSLDLPTLDVSGSDPVVYFVTAASPDFPVKIGATTVLRLRRRLQFLQTSQPFDLAFLYVGVGAPEVERQYHLRFWSDRLRGEWFRRTPVLLEFIAGLNVLDRDWPSRFWVEDLVAQPPSPYRER
jgi:hypothetical protein